MWGSPKHKYGARRLQTHDGRSFASKLESSLYDQLKLREKAGEIRDLECQVKVYLTDAEIGMIPDFRFFEIKTNSLVYAEAKGFQTPEYRIKRKLWKFYGPGKLEVWGGSYKSLKLVEVICPRT